MCGEMTNCLRSFSGGKDVNSQSVGAKIFLLMTFKDCVQEGSTVRCSCAGCRAVDYYRGSQETGQRLHMGSFANPQKKKIHSTSKTMPLKIFRVYDKKNSGNITEII